MISKKIKGLLNLKGLNISGLAEYLGISKQVLSNKLYRNSFSASDLIKIADYTNCKLAFISDDSQIVIMDIEDLTTKIDISKD